MTLHRVVAACLSAACMGSCAIASAAETEGSAANTTGGLRVRTFGPLPGNSVVDFALPNISSLLGSGPDRWLREATSLRQRIAPAWRLATDASSGSNSGLRASAGVVNVSRGTAYGVGPSNEQTVIDTITPRLGSGMRPAVTASAPYVGIGWREASGQPTLGQGGWGFNADLGLLALAPRSTVRFGRSAGGPLTMDDMVRDLRFAPMLQLGLTYSF